MVHVSFTNMEPRFRNAPFSSDTPAVTWVDLLPMFKPPTSRQILQRFAATTLPWEATARDKTSLLELSCFGGPKRFQRATPPPIEVGEMREP